MKLTLSNLLELDGKDKNNMNSGLQDFIDKGLKFKSDSLKRNWVSDWLITEANV